MRPFSVLPFSASFAGNEQHTFDNNATSSIHFFTMCMCGEGEVPWQGAAEKVSDNPSNTYIFISYWIIYLLLKHSKGSCYLFSLLLFRAVVCLVPNTFERNRILRTHTLDVLILHSKTRCNVHCSFSMASTTIISDRQFQRITFAAMFMLSLWKKNLSHFPSPLHPSKNPKKIRLTVFFSNFVCNLWSTKTFRVVDECYWIH